MRAILSGRLVAWRPETGDGGYQYDHPTRPGRFTGSASNPLTIDYYTDEGLLMALLAMGSPNPANRLGREVWDAIFRSTDGGNFVKSFPGSLFTYQFASSWINFDALGSDNHPTRPTDFFENTRRAIAATSAKSAGLSRTCATARSIRSRSGSCRR